MSPQWLFLLHQLYKEIHKVQILFILQPMYHLSKCGLKISDSVYYCLLLNLLSERGVSCTLCGCSELEILLQIKKRTFLKALLVMRERKTIQKVSVSDRCMSQTPNTTHPLWLLCVGECSMYNIISSHFSFVVTIDVVDQGTK